MEVELDKAYGIHKRREMLAVCWWEKVNERDHLEDAA